MSNESESQTAHDLRMAAFWEAAYYAAAAAYTSAGISVDGTSEPVYSYTPNAVKCWVRQFTERLPMGSSAVPAILNI